MSSRIDCISFDKICWVRFGTGIISFAFRGLPDDVHFSISYNDFMPFVNFHVTRNIGDPTCKPKVEIARISKDDLKALESTLFGTFFHSLLRPLPLKSRHRSHPQSYYGYHYFSFDHLDRDRPSDNGKIMMERFKACWPMETRRRKLKFFLEAEADAAGLLHDEAFKHSYQRSFTWLPKKPGKAVTGGIVHSPAFSGAVIYINGQWYAFREDYNFLELLYLLMDPDLADALIERTKAAVTLVSNARNFEDTRAYNDESILLCLLPMPEPNR